VSEPEEAGYTVEATDSAEAELDRIPDKDWQRIQSDLESLAKNPRPRNALKLDDDIYRLRRGDWRIIYRIYDDERYVLIGGARRRNERTYKGIDRLFRAHG
jgi:mRNA interferase RelE/StbE